MAKRRTIWQSLSIQDRQDSMRLCGKLGHLLLRKLENIRHISLPNHVRDTKNTYYLFVTETCQIVSFVRYIKYVVFGNYNLLV